MCIASERMLNIINETLEKRNIEIDTLLAHKTIVNLKLIVVQIIEANDEYAKSKSITIQFQVDGHDNQYNFLGVEIKLYEAINNLLNNAIKFSPLSSQINISLTTNDENIILTIKDNGPGFSEEDKLQMFNKYQKLSSKPTGDESSTGIGLSIVKQYLDSNHAMIKLVSEKGKGAEFIVKFQKEKN